MTRLDKILQAYKGEQVRLRNTGDEPSKPSRYGELIVSNGRYVVFHASAGQQAVFDAADVDQIDCGHWTCTIHATEGV